MKLTTIITLIQNPIVIETNFSGKHNIKSSEHCVYHQTFSFPGRVPEEPATKRGKIGGKHEA